jgi:uncharacterized protein YlbG (UPF0298 family)
VTFSVELQDPDEANVSKHVVHIYIDRDEVDQLIADLKQLKKSKDLSSVRFFTPSWGGDQLTEKLHRSDSVISNHLRIWLVD